MALNNIVIKLNKVLMMQKLKKLKLFLILLCKKYKQMGGAPGAGGMPNFGGAQPGAAPGTAGPNPGARGTATGGAEDVE